MRIKYLATYNGPNYGTGGYDDRLEAFASIRDAKDELDHRQRMEYGYVTTYARNDDDLFVPWSSETRYAFPGTTESDYMDLHGVTMVDEGVYLLHADPTYRLTVGPRKGIQVENY